MHGPDCARAFFGSGDDSRGRIAPGRNGCRGKHPGERERGRAAMLPQLGWLIGWLLLGGLLGRGMGLFIPNLHAWRASAAGAVGALVGACGFLLVSSLAHDMAGRLIGAAALGFAIGAMVAW